MAFIRGSLVLVVLALAGCGDGSSGDAGPGGETTSTGAPEVSTGQVPSTTQDSTSSTGSTTEFASTISGTSTGAGDSGESSEGGGVGTTGEGVCGLVELAEAAVEGAPDHEDCGAVDPWNDGASAWKAARDCALAAASEQRAFKLVTWMQGFDSQVGQAYVGLPDGPFAITIFHFDSDPCGGGGCGPVASQGHCAALLAVPECVVEPGGPCLDCAGQTMATQICGPQQ